MKKAAFALLLAVLGYLFAEGLALAYSDRRIAAEALKRLPETTGAQARVKGPLLLGLLFTGRIPRARLAMTHIDLGVHAEMAIIEMRGVHVSRSQLLHHNIDILRIEFAEATMEFGATALSSQLSGGATIAFVARKPYLVLTDGRVFGGTFEVRRPSTLVFVPDPGAPFTQGPSWGFDPPIVSCIGRARIKGDRLFLTCGEEDPPEHMFPDRGG